MKSFLKNSPMENSRKFKTAKRAQENMYSLFEGEDPHLKKRWTWKGETMKKQGYCPKAGKEIPVVATIEKETINNDEIKKAEEEGKKIQKKIQYQVAVVCPNVKNCLDAKGAKGEVSNFTNYLDPKDGTTKCVLETDANVLVLSTEAISLVTRISDMASDILKNIRNKLPY